MTSALRVILVAPQIAGNTGNIIRLCANTGSELHLVEPITFQLDDARLRRAGLDYHEYANVATHSTFDACLRALAGPRIFAFSARASVASARFDTPRYQPGDALVFGPESDGLSDDVLSVVPPGHILQIPMRPESRSLNLSNAVAVAIYEGLRQLNYPLD
jgi:tRNA (cytidine/uridine-2'-O-)-methyltransferase